jgi:hypothetical protein
MIEPAQLSANALRDPAVTFTVDCHFVGLSPGVGQFVFDHHVPPRFRRKERTRETAEGIGLRPRAARSGCVVGRKVSQQNLFLIPGEWLCQRRTFRIKRHGAQDLLPARLVRTRPGDPLGIVAGHAFRFNDGLSLAFSQARASAAHGRLGFGAALAGRAPRPCRRQRRRALHSERQIDRRCLAGCHLDGARRSALMLAADRLHNIFAGWKPID